MPKIKENLINIKTSATLEINELSYQLEKEGKKVYKFGLGQSPFPVPQPLVQELKANAYQKDYLNVSGLFKLRELIAKYHSKKNMYNYNSENVLIGPGSKELIFQTLLSIDSDLILPCPSWVSYEPQAQISNTKVHWIDTTKEDNWHISAKKLDEKCKMISNKEKLLIINSPNNPSGTNHPNLKELAEVSEKNKLIIISDEIYSELSFDGMYKSISHFLPERTIITSGISKWCGAGGWRLGTILFPHSLSYIKQTVRNIASETYTTVSAPIQYAATKAFSEDHEKYLIASRTILNFLSKYVHKKFSTAGIVCQKPQGGFYMLCDFTNIIKQNNEIIDSKTLCNKILKDTGFAMLPGSNFGFDKSKLITRIAFVDFDGEAALKYFYNRTKIDEDFLDQCSPNIKEGVTKLLEWLKNY